MRMHQKILFHSFSGVQRRCPEEARKRTGKEIVFEKVQLNGFPLFFDPRVEKFISTFFVLFSSLFARSSRVLSEVNLLKYLSSLSLEG